MSRKAGKRGRSAKSRVSSVVVLVSLSNSTSLFFLSYHTSTFPQHFEIEQDQLVDSYRVTLESLHSALPSTCCYIPFQDHELRGVFAHPSTQDPLHIMSQPAGRVLLSQSNSSGNIANSAIPSLRSNQDLKTGASSKKTTAPHAPLESSLLATPRASARNDPALATPGARRDHGPDALGNAASRDQPESKGSWRSFTRGEGLQQSEIDLASSAEVKRKANVCQLCECQLCSQRWWQRISSC